MGAESAVNSSDPRIGVMYLTSAPFPGGALYGLRSIVRQLDRKRFRPVVVLPEERAELADFFRGADVELATLRTRSLNRPSPLVAWDLGRAAWELAGLVRKYKVEVLHSTAPRAAVLGPVVRQLTGVKFVWQIAMLGMQGHAHFLARFADRAPCVSRAVYEEFGRRPNMQVVYNGPWTEGLRPEELFARRRELRQQLRIAEDALVVGSIANLQYWKGIHILLEAFARVARQLPGTQFVHLGGPVPGYEAYAGEIDAMYERLALGSRVRRLGFREDAYRYYPVFDLFVHTPVCEGKYRTTEAFGHTVAEAMGYRLPLIASRLGGPAEIVEEGVTGELVEPENGEELAEKILALLADPERRRRMGEAGYARYRRCFTIEREVDHYQRRPGGFTAIGSACWPKKIPSQTKVCTKSSSRRSRGFWSAPFRLEIQSPPACWKWARAERRHRVCWPSNTRGLFAPWTLCRKLLPWPAGRWRTAGSQPFT